MSVMEGDGRSTLDIQTQMRRVVFFELMVKKMVRGEYSTAASSQADD